MGKISKNFCSDFSQKKESRAIPSDVAPSIYSFIFSKFNNFFSNALHEEAAASAKKHPTARNFHVSPIKMYFSPQLAYQRENFD
jgi:hypothetical protein